LSGFCFVVGFFLILLSSLKKFISKNLVIIFKLNTIESFYYKERDFAIILVFLGSCHNLRKITKEEYICVCVCVCVCV
jgi:hypothetical protein